MEDPKGKGPAQGSEGDGQSSSKMEDDPTEAEAQAGGEGEGREKGGREAGGGSERAGSCARWHATWLRTLLVRPRQQRQVCPCWGGGHDDGVLAPPIA